MRTVTEDRFFKAHARPEEVAGVVRFWRVMGCLHYGRGHVDGGMAMKPGRRTAWMRDHDETESCNHRCRCRVAARHAALATGRQCWHVAIGARSRTDTDAFAVKVAAEVKGFDGNEYFGVRDAASSTLRSVCDGGFNEAMRRCGL